MCACLHELFRAATVFSLDGWSFSSACSCLMNPAVHVLIECFLCSHVQHSPPLSLSLPSPSLTPSTKSHQPLLLHRPSFPFLVCEVGRRRLMNKGSLTSHAFYEASGGTQTNNDAHRNAHLLTHNTHNTNSGDGKRERERPAESLSQLKC